MPILPTIDTLPTTSAAAIRVFDDRYLALLRLGPLASWATDIGLFDANAASPMTTFPISNLAFAYQPGSENVFRSIGPEKSFDVKASEFIDGAEVSVKDLALKAFGARAWMGAPDKLRTAEGRFRNLAITYLLENGTSTTHSANDYVPTGQATCYDGKAFFAADHPSDINDPGSTAWSNYQSSTKDPASLTDLEGEITAMRGVLGPDGRKLGVEPDTILLSTAKFQKVTNVLAQAQILDATGAAAISNPYLGKFKLVHVPELTDENDFYLVDSQLVAQGFAPWVMLRWAAPDTLGLRFWDESSDFFKASGKIRVSSHIWYGFALAMPHAIRLIKGA